MSGIVPSNEEAALLKDIRREFRGIPQAPVSLHVARAADDNELGAIAGLGSAREHRSWEDITESEFLQYQDVFPWLCPQSFVFYLPAFMTWTVVLGWKEATWIEGAFREPRDGSSGFDAAVLAVLSTGQRRVLLEFLKMRLRREPDDWNSDWWNHPLTPDWEDDMEKFQLWERIGPAFRLIERTLATDLNPS